MVVIAFLSLVGGNSCAQEYEVGSSETPSLIYENDLASIYRLPPKGTLEETSEGVASFILQQLVQKGLTDIVAEVTSVLVSKLGGLFLTFITEMPEVGIPTRVDLVVLARNEIAHTIQADKTFLPLIIVTAGDCFNQGVQLTYRYSPELFRWDIVTRVELLDFEELYTLYQKRTLQYGDRFLVIPKKPFRLSTAGKYRLFAEAWCDSEGKSSYALHVVEALRERTQPDKTGAIIEDDARLISDSVEGEIKKLIAGLNKEYSTDITLVIKTVGSASDEAVHNLARKVRDRHNLDREGNRLYHTLLLYVKRGSILWYYWFDPGYQLEREIEQLLEHSSVRSQFRQNNYSMAFKNVAILFVEAIKQKYEEETGIFHGSRSFP